MLSVSEKLSLRDVRELLGPRRGGRPIGAATLHRWMFEGLRGVRLQSERQGSLLYTTQAWLDEFFAGVEKARQKDQAARRQGVRRAS